MDVDEPRVVVEGFIGSVMERDAICHVGVVGRSEQSESAHAGDVGQGGAEHEARRLMPGSLGDDDVCTQIHLFTLGVAQVSAP